MRIVAVRSKDGTVKVIARAKIGRSGWRVTLPVNSDGSPKAVKKAIASARTMLASSFQPATSK